MNLKEIQDAFQMKCIELETAIETGKPQKELLRIYKELKELRYRLMEEEIKSES